jgi:hypothetical protein
MEEKMIGVDSMEDYGMIDEIFLSFETLIGLLVVVSSRSVLLQDRDFIAFADPN